MEETSKLLTRWLSILGVLTGLVALGISWQANILAREANSIALQQASGRLTVFDAEISGGVSYNTNDDNVDVVCTTRVRLTNLGGAALTVTDFKATIKHSGEVTILESYGPGASSGLGVIPQEEFPNTWFEFQVVPEEAFRGRNTSDTGQSSAVFPLKIEGC